MKLDALIKAAGPAVRGVFHGSDAVVTGLSADSRRFQAGDLFVAVKGAQFDGHAFISEACARGAAAVAVEDVRVIPSTFHNPVIHVNDSRQFLRAVAPVFFEHPSSKLFVAGVTGTNGKTTTSHMIESVLNGRRWPTGVIGTIDYHLGSQKLASANTTPDALDLQSTLADWVQQGAKALSIEVSSHAIAIGRADALEFDCAVFTNLTRDHLDFHKTMEAYTEAKARLFRVLLESSPKPHKRAIMNADDPATSAMLPPKVPVWTYGFGNADLRATDVRLSLDGTQFQVHTPKGNSTVNLKMIGRHNVSNALAAIGVGLHAGADLEQIILSLSKLNGVRGRLEKVEAKRASRVFVDYAHSDDALINVLGFLESLRDQTSPGSKIITVFGCGGDRDRGKRPLMMKAARQYSDIVVVTSDNPRTEDPQQIIGDILSQTPGADVAAQTNILVDADRRRAIELALMKAQPQDVVLIAGKGHEDYQIIGTRKYPFDDVQVAKEILDR